MLLKYTPEGEEAQEWSVDLDRLMSSEAEAIEKVTDMTYEAFGVALKTGSMTARRALLWILLKRKMPTLRHKDIDAPTGSILFEFETHELREIRAAVVEATELTDVERASALALIDEQLGDGDDETPKAPASDDASSD